MALSFQHAAALGMFLDKAKRGDNPTCVRQEMCKTCPFAFDMKRLDAFHDCETMEYFEMLSDGGGIHPCHSRGKHNDISCRGFVEHFEKFSELVEIK